MKQICIARNNDDVTALLGHAEAVMRDIRTNPSKEDVYSNPDSSSLSGIEILASATEIDLHINGSSRTLSLPLADTSIDTIVASAMQNSDTNPSGPSSPTARVSKGIKN